MALTGAVHPLLLLEGEDRVGDEAAIPLVDRIARVRETAVRLRELRVAMQGSRLRDRKVDVGRGRPLVAEERLDVPDRTGDLRNHGVTVLRVVDRKAQHVA